MSMHMIHGVRAPLSKKKKSKKKIDMVAMEVEWRRYNKDMRRKNCHAAQFDTLEDYIDYRSGKRKKYKTEFVPYTPVEPFRRETREIPSLGCGVGNGFKKETSKYTGDLIVGIATMHKSNAVPVMRDTDQAKDIAQMRRN